MKTILIILLSVAIAAIPMTSQSTEFITINPLTQSIELPSNIPKDVQEQIRVVIATTDGLFSWVEGFVALAIVVVGGVILYCLWRCSQMIPEPQPQQPPDDPAVVGLPGVLLYNLQPAPSCALQWGERPDSSDWHTLLVLTNEPATVDIYPRQDAMFFRLLPNP